MPTDPYSVYIEPDGRRIDVAPDQTLMEALTHAGLFLRADCGGKGRCGKCRIKLLPGPGQRYDDLPLTQSPGLSLADQRLGDRLACRLVVDRDLHVEIPETSLFSADVIQKAPLNLPAELARSKPLAGNERFGLAVDLGTTTIALYLCALESRQVLGSLSIKNPQAQFGDDVMSRISAIRAKAGLLDRMQSMAVKAIEWGALTLSEIHGIDPVHIARMAAVGNSTMIHILVGESPASLGVHPFEPRFTAMKKQSGEALGFTALPRMTVETLPLISAFLGSDIIAAALGVDFEDCDPGTILADVGTNGEVMLKTEDGILATSCATGPAFEGASLSCGMHAIIGAIDAVKIEAASSPPTYSLIERKPGSRTRPAGICGSGIVSVVAEAYRHKILNPDGSFNTTCGNPALQTANGGLPRLVLADEATSATGLEVAVSQKDIRAIQLAKGALKAGIDMLLAASVHQRPRRILLAGAFGSYLDKVDVLTIGMFPPIRETQIDIMGNAAGVGAVRYLLESAAGKRIAAIKTATRVVLLATDPAFQKAFIAALSFPEPPKRV
jgi:uncharacterized 2Fe-2S/4Fe-4S cluster protein (DUF4445 family)